MKQQHTDKNGNTWEWEVTSETEAALKKLQTSIKDNIRKKEDV